MPVPCLPHGLGLRESPAAGRGGGCSSALSGTEYSSALGNPGFWTVLHMRVAAQEQYPEDLIKSLL